MNTFDVAAAYTAAYREAARVKQVEDIEDIEQELAELGYTVAFIEIGRVRDAESAATHCMPALSQGILSSR